MVHYFCNRPGKLIYCSTKNNYKVSNAETLCYEGQ